MNRFRFSTTLLAALTPALLFAGDLSETSRAPYLIKENFVAPQTTKEARDTFYDETVAFKIEEALQKPVTENDDNEWGGAFWNAALLNYNSITVRNAINQGFAAYAALSGNTQRIIMQSAYTIFPGEFSMEAEQSLDFSKSVKAFAIGAYIILKAEDSPEKREMLKSKMEEIFPDWKETPQLVALAERLEASLSEELRNRPPLVDLFAAPIMEGRPVVFSIQRVNRSYPGIALVRHADGTFARDEDGSIFNVSQHALSRTNMPGTITYGNSPRGIFSVKGTGSATNQFIGPVPYLWSRVPVEADVEDYFFGESEATEWTRDLYASLLPESWQSYRPMYEAWLAGQSGRSEMIMHGTTIDPEWYKNEGYYPQTPSAGCLGTIEFWNPEDGSLEYSDQLSLLKNYLHSGMENGLLVVVEIDDRDAPVRLDDVIRDLLDAEKLLHSASE